jgi:hypothetical protein
MARNIKNYCQHGYGASRVSISMLFCLMTLTACSTVSGWLDSDRDPDRQMHPVSVAPVGYTDPILHYYDWLTTADDSAIATERTYLEFHYQDAADPIIGVQLALLLSLHSADNSRQLERAKEILSAAANSNVSADRNSHAQEYRAFATLWRDVLSQRIQLLERLGEQQAERAQLQSNLSRLRQENEELAQQIEALMAIEQQLNLREQLQVIP